MADPISLLGTAVGVASLAIQLSSGISSYIDALRCREEDLKSIKRRFQSFRASIAAIEAIEQRLCSESLTIPPQLPLVKCIQVCKDELVALTNFWEKFNQQTSRTTGFGDRIRVKAWEISYPFCRDDLSRLEARLGQATQILNTSLQTIQL